MSEPTIDLDELQRLAEEANAGARWDSRGNREDYSDYFYVLDPPVILALLARLRRAEAALRMIHTGASGNAGACLDCDTIRSVVHETLTTQEATDE